MREKAQDALTYVKHHGTPDLFITFTCNPKWPEIKDCIIDGEVPADRHDIVARVFHLKQQKMLNVITKGGLFGKAVCHMLTVEWQKVSFLHFID